MKQINIRNLCVDRKSFYGDLWISAMTFAVIGCVVWSLRNVALGTHDDLNNYIKIKELSINEYMSNTLISMLTRGRFSVTMILTNIAFYYFTKSSSHIIYLIIMYLPIIFNVYIFAYIVGKRYNKYLGLAIPLFFFTFIQVDIYHNLMVSYPLFFHVGFFMFLIGLELYIKYYEKNIKYYLWVSAIFMFDSFSTYESFVTYIMVFIIISMYYNYDSLKVSKKEYIKTNIDKLKYHLIAVLIYIAIYIICRKIWNFNYGGAIIDTNSFNARLALKTLFTFSFSLFPLREFFTGDLADRLNVSQIGLRMLVKASAASLAMGIILIKSTKIKYNIFIPIISISFVASIVFCIPHALTPQYQTWVNAGTTGFVPSYFSYFWLVLIICAISINAINKINKLKIPVTILVMICIIFGSFMTDFSNSETIKVKQADTIRYKMFERLVQSSFYSNIEEDAAIYVVNYIGIHYRLESLGEYGSLYSGKIYNYSNKIDEVMKSKNRYYMAYSYNDQCIYMCKMTSYMVSDTIFIISNDNSIKRLLATKKSQVDDDKLSEELKREFNYMYLSQPIDFRDGVIITVEDLDLTTLDLVT